MRKQTKVLAAAALFTLGASFSAFAAKTGTWALEDEGWVCYDADGDAYTDEWCLSNGKEFYVDSDGIMVASDWVNDGEDYYFVGSDGTKTINDWRYVTPYDDEDADEEWYYFGSKGKLVTSAKKVISGNTYYFDASGVMLTGWVNATNKVEAEAGMAIADLVYCDENGARVAKDWIKVYEPGVDVEEDDLDDLSQYWYYLGSSGTPAVGKKANISGQTYLFDVNGHMLSGWVAEYTYENAEGNDVVAYTKVGVKDQVATISTYDAVYFCGDSDDGHVKKAKWIKTWKNTEYNAADDDNDQYWFYLENDGKVYVPTASESNAADKYSFKEGALVEGDAFNFATRTINKKVYAFNGEGEMVSGFLKTDAGMYYYGGSNDGARKTGSISIEDDCDTAYKFYFSTESGSKGVGMTGAKSGKLYEDGLLVTSEDYKYADVNVNGKDYIVNASGTIQTTNKKYEDGDFCKDLTNNDTQTVTFNDGKTDSTIKGSYTITPVTTDAE